MDNATQGAALGYVLLPFQGVPRTIVNQNIVITDYLLLCEK